MNINSNIVKQRVSELKKNATKSEILFIAKLKYNNIKYEFQKPINYGFSYYIADFFILKYNIIVEIDGSSHNTDKQKIIDQRKDDFYHSKGYKVLRIKNEDVDSFDTKSLKTYKGTLSKKQKENCIFLKNNSKVSI